MKKITVYILVSLMFCIGPSCRGKEFKDTETEYLSAFLNGLHIDDHTKWVVVLPGLGCHGCIQEGEAFMKDNIKNKDIFFVITSIESLKILQLKIGANIKDFPNVYADKENKLNIPTDNKIYPCIIRWDKGVVREHIFQSPQNSEAFSQLKALIGQL